MDNDNDNSLRECLKCRDCEYCATDLNLEEPNSKFPVWQSCYRYPPKQEHNTRTQVRIDHPACGEFKKRRVILSKEEKKLKPIDQL